MYYQHLLVSFEGLLSLRLSDHFTLVVGCINNNWLNLWKKDACKVFTGISPPPWRVQWNKAFYPVMEACQSSFSQWVRRSRLSFAHIQPSDLLTNLPRSWFLIFLLVFLSQAVWIVLLLGWFFAPVYLKAGVSIQHPLTGVAELAAMSDVYCL